jgi:hypothetical protein
VRSGHLLAHDRYRILNRQRYRLRGQLTRQSSRPVNAHSDRCDLAICQSASSLWCAFGTCGTAGAAAVGLNLLHDRLNRRSLRPELSAQDNKAAAWRRCCTSEHSGKATITASDRV